MVKKQLVISSVAEKLFYILGNLWYNFVELMISILLFWEHRNNKLLSPIVNLLHGNLLCVYYVPCEYENQLRQPPPMDSMFRDSP